MDENKLTFDGRWQGNSQKTKNREIDDFSYLQLSLIKIKKFKLNYLMKLKIKSCLKTNKDTIVTSYLKIVNKVLTD